MMLGAAAYLLMMQMNRSAAQDTWKPEVASGAVLADYGGPGEDWLTEANVRIADLNKQLRLAKEQLELAEIPFGSSGSNMPISSYDPAMFPIRTVPGSNCSNMPIYVWRPDPPQEPSATPVNASTFVPLRSVGP